VHHLIMLLHYCLFFFFSSRRRNTRSKRDWSSDVCSSDLKYPPLRITGDVVLRDAQRRVLGVFLDRRGQIGAGVEKVVLDVAEHRERKSVVEGKRVERECSTVAERRAVGEVQTDGVGGRTI